jgi:hypothetical protein
VESGGEHGVRRPAHDVGCVVAGEAGDIGQPDERFDAGRASDGEGEAMYLGSRYPASQGCERLFDPLDRAALSKCKL